MGGWEQWASGQCEYWVVHANENGVASLTIRDQKTKSIYLISNYNLVFKRLDTNITPGLPVKVATEVEAIVDSFKLAIKSRGLKVA